MEGEKRTANSNFLERSGEIPPGALNEIPQNHLPPPLSSPESRTEKGLRYIRWGLIIQIINVLLRISAIIVLDITHHDRTLMNILNTIIFQAGNMILTMIALIIWIYGFYNMFIGRREFGVHHELNVRVSLILGGAFIVFFIAQSYYIFEFHPRGWDYFWFRFYVGLISFYLISTSWIFLIKTIVPPILRIFLWVFLLITLAGITGTMVFTGQSTFDGKVIGQIFWLSTLLVVGYFFHKTYTRLRRKEIHPILPPPIPYPYPPRNLNTKDCD